MSDEERTPNEDEVEEQAGKAHFREEEAGEPVIA